MIAYPVPINPPEYGIRLWGEAEERAVITALRIRDGFRFNGGRSAAAELEARIAHQVDAPECVVTTNGSAALQAALFAVGVRAGDDVLVNALTFHATSNAVLRLGATPVPIDLDLKTNLSIDDLLHARSPKASAVVAVHWPGRAFDLSRVAAFCREQDLALVEDACQAFHAKSAFGYAGTQGDVGVYSFQQNKLLTSGEGGALVTANPEFARQARIFGDQGVDRSGPFQQLRGRILPGADNLRLTGIHASVLLAQMEKLDHLLNDLRRTKALVSESLNQSGIQEWHQYSPETTGQVLALCFATRDSAETATTTGAARGILLRPLWQTLFHEAYGGHRVQHTTPCPKARDVLARVRLLPLPFGLDESQRSAITGFCETLKGDCVE